MRLRSLRDHDTKIRLSGGALILLAALCLAVLPADRGHPDAQPTVMELCIAFLAVSSGCAGAAFLFEGRKLFEPVSDSRARRNVHGHDPRDGR